MKNSRPLRPASKIFGWKGIAEEPLGAAAKNNGFCYNEILFRSKGS